MNGRLNLRAKIKFRHARQTYLKPFVSLLS